MGLVSLGCAKNLVDAEVMVGSLLKDGLEITNDAASADVVIVNTCSFIDAAQEESVDAILESDAVREANNRGQGLIVSGCLPQRFRAELPRLLPEVDAFMGIDQVAQVSEVVKEALVRRARRIEERTVHPKKSRRLSAIATTLAKIKRTTQSPLSPPMKPGAAPGNPGDADPSATSASAALLRVSSRPVYIPDFATPRFRLTPKHFAYVKIAEGCNHPCSFCIIPRMRGSHRSRLQSDIVAEARSLLAQGVRELNLISQDSTYYGLDLREDRNGSIASPEKFRSAAIGLPANATTLCTLLRDLNALPGTFWIRLLYTHPAHWTDELIQTIAACGKVARYVDMPLQHIHDGMLERMRRETSQQYIVDLIKKIRAGIPGIAIRTTFIVGFPGETDEHFETLRQFICTTRFERLGVFAYSREEGTRAGKMEQQVSEAVKQRRRKQAMADQQVVAREIAQGFVGRTLRVLVEGEARAKDLSGAQLSSWEHGLIRGPQAPGARLRGQYFVARGEADAPDIDGRVYVRGGVEVGDFAEVQVTGGTDYDLLAEPV